MLDLRETTGIHRYPLRGRLREEKNPIIRTVAWDVSAIWPKNQQRRRKKLFHAVFSFLLSLLQTSSIRNKMRIRDPSLSPFEKRRKRIIVCWILRKRPVVQDVRGTSSTPTSVSALPLAPVKPSTLTLTMLMNVVSSSEVVLSIRIDVVEGEAELGK